jgi:hypothetical protein
MGQAGFDKHQLAGLDHRERGFSRPVEFQGEEDGYRAILRYEAVRMTTDVQPTQDEALTLLIQTLHAQGYRQLKTQLSFRHGVYLGSQELWVEYPDPPQTEPEQSGFFARIKNWFRSPSPNE